MANIFILIKDIICARCIMYQRVRYGSGTPSKIGYDEMSKKTNNVDELFVVPFGHLILKTVNSLDPPQSQLDGTLNLK